MCSATGIALIGVCSVSVVVHWEMVCFMAAAQCTEALMQIPTLILPQQFTFRLLTVQTTGFLVACSDLPST